MTITLRCLAAGGLASTSTPLGGKNGEDLNLSISNWLNRMTSSLSLMDLGSRPRERHLGSMAKKMPHDGKLALPFGASCRKRIRVQRLANPPGWLSRVGVLLRSVEKLQPAGMRSLTPMHRSCKCRLISPLVEGW